MGARFELPAELNIYNAIQTRETLVAWLEKLATEPHGELLMSARDVAEVDGAGLQLLAALSNSGVAWRVVDASTVFTDACRTMGFSQWIGPEASPAVKGVA